MAEVTKRKEAEQRRDHRVSVGRVAERFKLARRAAGLSLRQVAEKSGLAASTIHKLEAGRVVPSLAVCIRLADALGRRISHFVEEGESDRVDVRFLSRGAGRVAHARRSLLHFEYVAEPLMNPRMEAFVVTVAPRGKSGADVPIRYRGEEVVFGLDGCVRFWVRGESYLVGPGDTLHLKGIVPHTWENGGTKPARLLMVCAFAYERE
ncbi:MAG TPA: XRE family transcriptional regulator [Candidatus Acidoferrales bacterium]|nr:XRE family transcriptional regulator [Candidatus Acidoferrales bacterium]